MARRKDGYTTEAGYHIGPKTYEKLRREIKNYNRRLARAQKKDPTLAEFMPRKLKLSEEREKIASQKEANLSIRELQTYTSENLQVTEIQGLIMTRGEFINFQRRRELENQRRAERKKQLEQYQKQEGRFPVQTDEAISPIPENPRTLTHLRNYLEHTGQQYFEHRTNIWRENYLQTLDDAINNAIIGGYMTPETVEIYNRIRETVSGMSAEGFYYAQNLLPETNIQVLYEGEALLSAMEEIEAAWTRAVQIEKSLGV